MEASTKQQLFWGLVVLAVGIVGAIVFVNVI